MPIESQNSSTAHILPNRILLGEDAPDLQSATNSRPEFAKIPVIVMTAGGDSQENIYSLHANAYLQKPTDIDHLFKTIASVAEQKRHF